MSEGTRCDGCKEMIYKLGEDFLELTVQRREGVEEGRTAYYRRAADKHFHNRYCLDLWVDRIGWWDHAFADDVSNSQKPKLPIFAGSADRTEESSS